MLSVSVRVAPVFEAVSCIVSPPGAGVRMVIQWSQPGARTVKGSDRFRSRCEVGHRLPVKVDTAKKASGLRYLLWRSDRDCADARLTSIMRRRIYADKGIDGRAGGYGAGNHGSPGRTDHRRVRDSEAAEEDRSGVRLPGASILTGPSGGAATAAPTSVARGYGGPIST